ncbi:hypothetical protein IM678_17140 [Dickeya fangzhongdai]|uniref:Uncharacterized protein n=2 Tax=Pectobacteriaceae TaxID=1903410 RepID=A0A2K8QQG7_9GAMM|nr:hypothetical protein CVE23_18420 [Dickeya fangzhongdai]AYH49415.1 hypothetical protein B6N31_18075 [Dickeya fangzhongdai]MBO8135567.1 hypothetical protein [Dickeya fangzhongdai]QOH49213.1 hypothetical protein DYD82_18490 [Dickeya fangzhongdai]QOH53516.1 hypothetical protein DYD83_18490 [Dickeya fangzhongdai]
MNPVTTINSEKRTRILPMSRSFELQRISEAHRQAMLQSVEQASNRASAAGVAATVRTLSQSDLNELIHQAMSQVLRSSDEQG